jgi:hypothetical protein
MFKDGLRKSIFGDEEAGTPTVITSTTTTTTILSLALKGIQHFVQLVSAFLQIRKVIVLSRFINPPEQASRLSHPPKSSDLT